MSGAPFPAGIFVVENHVDTLSALTTILKRAGYRVCTATSMQEALEKLPISKCDILLSDIGLPDGDGWELLQTVAMPQPMYAIAVSGYGTSLDRRRSEEAGFKQHLVKPLDPKELLQLLNEAVRVVKEAESAA